MVGSFFCDSLQVVEFLPVHLFSSSIFSNLPFPPFCFKNRFDSNKKKEDLSK
jgi:hypothetical protein